MDMKEGTRIVLTAEDGGKEVFFVIEETKINNVNYLLVSKSMDNGSDAYILKDMSAPEEAEARYEFVDDDEEIDYIGKIFAELLDGEDIGLE